MGISAQPRADARQGSGHFLKDLPLRRRQKEMKNLKAAPPLAQGKNEDINEAGLGWGVK